MLQILPPIIKKRNLGDFKFSKMKKSRIWLKKFKDCIKRLPQNNFFFKKKYEDIGNKFSKSNVVLTVSVNFSGLVPEWEEIAATAMAVQNMHLTCAANNVGAYWGTPGMKDYLGKFLQLEENQKCYGLFFMGMIQN